MTAVWTDPATPVTLTTITTSFWNVNGRDNLNVLRANTGSGDPTTAGQVAIATAPNVTAWGLLGTSSYADGSVTAVKLASGAVVSHLGYTPANKAGDLFTGDVQAANLLTGGNLSANGEARGNTLRATVATGTAPLTIASTTMVPNLNADMVDGVHASTIVQTGGSPTLANLVLTGNLNAAGEAKGSWLTSTVATGTAPVQVTSTTLCPNLNVPLLSGHAVTDFVQNGSSPTLANLTLSGGNLNAAGEVKGSTLNATVTSGTSPLTIASATKVPNLNADRVDDAHASATPTANTIPIANGSGTLAPGWLSGITDSQIASANKDGAAGTASMRTLGTGAAQAAAGNHGHSLMARISSGSYAGNSGVKAISGLGFAPAIVSVMDGAFHAHSTIQNGQVLTVTEAAQTARGTASMDSDGFSFTDAGGGANVSGRTYTWIAIG